MLAFPTKKLLVFLRLLLVPPSKIVFFNIAAKLFHKILQKLIHFVKIVQASKKIVPLFWRKKGFRQAIGTEKGKGNKKRRTRR